MVFINIVLIIFYEVEIIRELKNNDLRRTKPGCDGNGQGEIPRVAPLVAARRHLPSQVRGSGHRSTEGRRMRESVQG